MSIWQTYQLRLSVEAAEPIAQAIIRLRDSRGERKVLSTQFIAFSGYMGNADVDGAAAALQKAGYIVHRLPDKYRKYLELPLDDHMEAVFATPDNDENTTRIWDEINAIVDKFGGYCGECGPITTDYKPFVDLFYDIPEFVP
jgi:hypothetical protein